MNVIVVCPRCGREMIVHAHSLEWIRCQGCHKGVNIARNSKVATSKDRIQSPPRLSLRERGG